MTVEPFGEALAFSLSSGPWNTSSRSLGNLSLSDDNWVPEATVTANPA